RVSVLSPTTNVLICVLMDSHRRHVCADGHTRTHRQPQIRPVCVTDTHGPLVCADGHIRTHTDSHVHPVCLTDSHGQPRTSCVCWRTPTDVLCVRTDSPRGPKSPKQSTGRASVLSPRTNSTGRASVLICVLMDSHGHPVCAEGHTCTHTDVLCLLMDTHGRPMCADRQPRTATNPERQPGRPVCAGGHPRTSCPRTSYVCWRTPTDILCVLNRQPTWAQITQTVHEKGQGAESKDQRADMCTDGQPRTSNTHGHTRTATDVLCVLTDSHRQPQTQTHTDSHGRPVCAGGNPQTSCVHVRPLCADGQPRTSHSPHGPKSPKQSTGRASVLSPGTNVLICVLMDSHGRHVCADRHRRTHTDSHGHPVCAGGHPRTQPTWAKITRTVHGKGQRAESKDQHADISTDVLCLLTDKHRHTWTATDVLCTQTDTHGQPRTSCVCWRTPTDVLSTDVLCVVADTHGRPLCTEQTAHVGQNHPNSRREGPAC
ncbi:unnamed protein product, partial [Brassica rapa]